MLDGRLAKLKKTLDAFFKGVDQSIFYVLIRPRLSLLPVASEGHSFYFIHTPL
jgi:hypothetical protein